MVDGWKRRQEIKRGLVSWLLAFGLFGFVFGTWFIAEILWPRDLSPYSGPVLVRLGVPDGSDSDVPEIISEPPVEPEAQPPEDTPLDETTPADESEPDDTNQSLAMAPSPAPSPIVRTSPRPSQRPSPRPSPQASVLSVSSPRPSPIAGPVTVRGVEQGSANETTFETSSGGVTRNLGAAIYLYMPLPAELSATVYNRLQASDSQSLHRIIEGAYNAEGTVYRLLDQPDLPDRPVVWQFLESAGYDIQQADYKKRRLTPVVISFVVGPSASGNAPVKTAKVDNSSGYSDIDQAVLYGFRQASFSNSEGRDINGRFTYRFE